MTIQKKEKPWVMIRHLVIMLVLSAACMISGAVLLTGCGTPSIIKGPEVSAFVVGDFEYEIRSAANRTARVVGVAAGRNPTSINIPAYVTISGTQYSVMEIKDDAFKNNKTVTSLSLPGGLDTIGYSAFEGCSNMAKNGLSFSGKTYIYDRAFYGCASLTGTLSLGGSVYNYMDIYSYAFAGCTGFTSLSLGALDAYGSYIFSGCTGFTGELRTHRGYTTEFIPSIPEGMFYGCSGFTSLTIDIYTDSIGKSAFEGCTGLKGALTIPNNVKEIRDNAFKNCGFNSTITLGSGLQTIGAGAFQGCNGLRNTLTFPTTLGSIGASAFEGCTGFTGALDFKSVTGIGASAFKGASGFTGALDLSKMSSIGASAFEGCTGFRNGLTLPNYVGTIINDRTFYNCRFTGSLNIHNGVISIGVGAFYGCNGFSSLSLGNSLTTIAASAFEGCTSLTGTLTIPASVTSIGASAFSGTNFNTIRLQRFTAPSTITTLANINALPARPSPLTRIVVPLGAGTAYRAAANWSNATVRPYICEATVQLHFAAGLPPENCDQVIGTVGSIGTSGAPVWSMATFPALPNGGFSVPNNSWKQVGWSLDPNIANRCLLFGETLADTDFEIGADIVPEWLNGTSMTFYPVWERAFTRGTVILHNVGGPNGGLGINAYFDFDPSDEETYKLYSAEFMNERGHELEFQGWYMSTSLDFKTKIKLTETDDDGKFIIPWTEAPFAGLFPVVHVFARWG